MTCIFCTASKHAIIENERFYAIADKYPVTPGHLLLIPKAHRRDYFALTQEELQDLQALLQEGKAYLLETYRPDGFNIGFNLRGGCWTDGLSLPLSFDPTLPRRRGAAKRRRSRRDS